MKRICAALLCAMLLTLCAGALAAEKANVTYIDASGAKKTCAAAKEVSADDTAWSDDWYVVSVDVTLNGRVTVSGDVHLILMDGATLEAPEGIRVAVNDSLTIYGQTKGTGSLLATGVKEHAPIGGNEREDCGSITINGGVIEAVVDGSSEDSAGIGGGGDTGDDQGGDGGNVTINGGKVTAIGGEWAAGIGGGYWGNGGTTTINGGKVTAIGGEWAAGIGGGDEANGGTTEINGGKVTAAGGYYGAGIGGGDWGKGGTTTINGGEVNATGGRNAAGIGGGDGGYGGTTEITGGEVNATGGEDAAGIGGGSWGDGGTTEINGGKVTAAGGYYGAGIGGGDWSNGGTTEINGGEVNATGGEGAAGIGGGGGWGSAGTTIIRGGEVIATGMNGADGIGKGSHASEGQVKTDRGYIEPHSGTAILVKTAKDGVAKTYTTQTAFAELEQKGYLHAKMVALETAPDTTGLPKTGDESQILLWAALMALGAAGYLCLKRSAA